VTSSGRALGVGGIAEYEFFLAQLTTAALLNLLCQLGGGSESPTTELPRVVRLYPEPLPDLVIGQAVTELPAP